MNKLDIQASNIYAVGDIHGYFSSLISMIKRYEIVDSCIIVCGDCGLGFYGWESTKAQLKKLNDVCKKHNVNLVMFRGNHDDPSFFTQGNITSNIIPVPDYTVVNEHIICVGGGTSIDRQYRMALKDKYVKEYFRYHPNCTIEEGIDNTPNFYWPDELPVYNENIMNEIKEAGIQITTVCTHTCPSFCDPATKDGIKEWIKVDPDLNVCIDEERNVMDCLHQKLLNDGHPLKEWIYGHYHRHNMQDISGVKYMMLGAVTYDGGNVDWCEIRIS